MDSPSGRPKRVGIGSWCHRRSRPPAAQTPSPVLGNVLKSLKTADIDNATKSEDSNNPKIEACHYVASYSWLDAHTASIITPGLPPTWTPPKPAPQLQGDSGQYFRDINSAKYPAHPMEAAVRAVVDSELMTDYNKVDIFGCGSTLGNLLRFARQKEEKFRVIVEVVGSTVFLLRRENSPHEIIHGIYGYGHTMPEAYTTWQAEVKGSESHQRVIRYKFAGLDCLVRFEADGYLPNLCPDLLTKKDTEKEKKSTSEQKDGPTSLAEALEMSMIGPKITKDGPLSVKQGGAIAPQSSLFDLKTRTQRRSHEDHLAEQLPRLWVRQVPNFVLGFHDDGRFDDIRVDNVEDEIEKWADKNREGIKKFGSLLKKVVSLARENEDKRLELEYDGGGDLRVREVGGEAAKAISAGLKERWIGSHEPAA